MSDPFEEIARRFPQEGESAWRRAVAAVRGAKDPESLTARSYDGIAIEPLYDRARAAPAVAAAGAVGAAPFIRGALRDPASPWVVGQRIDMSEPAEANRQILADLEGGASGLVIVCGSRERPGGVRLDTTADVARLLDGVLPELISITLDAGGAARRMAALFAAWLGTSHELARLRFCAGLDAVGGLTSGRTVAPARLASRQGDCAKALLARGFRGPFFLADGRPWHAAGASEAQELAYALASAVECLRALESSGLDLDEAAGLVAFQLAVDADQFASIAKIRAARRLWSRMLEASGCAPRPAQVRVESAWRMLTARDPWVNLMRATVAAFAGAVGGADEIVLHPHAAAAGAPDAFARRIVRNVQLVLMEEAGLGWVADPAGGSGYVENLTEASAATAWGLFQEVEAQGGLIAALRAGAPQRRVAEVREARAKDVARRRLAITGVSEFPSLDDAPHAPSGEEKPTAPKAKPPVRAWPKPGDGAWFGAQIDALRDGASVEALGAPDVATVAAEALPRIRLAEPFEALRDAADAFAVRTGAPPRAFLATLGPLADTVDRATFVRAFLAAGGIHCSGGDEIADVAALVVAFRADGARVACLCAPDAVYETLGVEAAQALRAAGATTVAVAGEPPCRDRLAAAGAGPFLRRGADALAALGDLQARLGVLRREESP
jgi:methylmalonyl-CoA mutase